MNAGAKSGLLLGSLAIVLCDLAPQPCGVLAVSLPAPGISVGRAQENPAIEHATHVLDMLREDRFADVAKEFTAQVAAALSAEQLRDVWTGIGQQVGPFTAVIDRQVTTIPSGHTAVVVGCQFEKAALNVVVVFDGEGRIAGLRFTPRAAQPTPAPASPPSSRFTEESVTVGSGEWALPGTLTLPIGPVSAAVVLVHGSGPHDRDETLGPNKPFRDLAWGLADRGVAVLRYEKRTRQHGAKMAGRAITVQQETVEDALLAAQLLRTRERIDPKRVFLVGHSLGGMLAPRIAGQDRALAGLVILAGQTRPFAVVVREQMAYLSSLGAAQGSPAHGIEDSVQAVLRGLPGCYVKDLDANRPAEKAAALSVPMLILQGERDYQVTMEDLQGWRTALDGRAGVTIKTYPTLNHLFLPGEGRSTPAEYERPGQIPAFVLDDIADWVKRQPAAADSELPQPPTGSKRVRVGSTLRGPVRAVYVAPEYPAAAREAGITGVVIIEVWVDEAGKVTVCQVLRSVPGLDDAAIEAVRKWEYQPTMLAGKPVPIIMTVTVAFPPKVPEVK